MRAFDRFFFGPVAAARPALLMRVVYLLVAFDAWSNLLARAPMYGAGNFNVAHFGWLDVVQPMPSPALYVGNTILLGLLSGVLALTLGSRLLRCLAALLATYSWAMSQIDVYQHHVFLSLLFGVFVFFPTRDELAPYASGSARKPRTLAAWGYVLMCCTVANLYLWTALAKLDASWRAGHVLEQLSIFVHLTEPVRALLAGSGLGERGAWTAVTLGIIATELLIAVAYLAAVHRDTGVGRGTTVWASLACATAIGLHLGIEMVGFRIGWFSYYMIALAVVVFAPARALALVESLLRAAGERLSALWRDRLDRVTSPSSRSLWALALSVPPVALALGMGRSLEFPGGGAVALFVALGSTAALFWSALRGRLAAAPGHALAILLAVAGCWTAIAHSDVRTDYYRLVADDLRHRGELHGVTQASRNKFSGPLPRPRPRSE